MSAQHPLFTKKQRVSEAPNGAFAIGYRSHFGLGLFLPIMDLEAAQLNESDSAASNRNRPKL